MFNANYINLSGLRHRHCLASAMHYFVLRIQSWLQCVTHSLTCILKAWCYEIWINDAQGDLLDVWTTDESRCNEPLHKEPSANWTVLCTPNTIGLVTWTCAMSNGFCTLKGFVVARFDCMYTFVSVTFRASFFKVEWLLFFGYFEPEKSLLDNGNEYFLGWLDRYFG